MSEVIGASELFSSWLITRIIFFHVSKPVERGDGGDLDEQSDRRRDERFRDARHHGLRRRCVCSLFCSVSEVLERFDDSDDGAEESDERRVVAERAEVREPSLELHALKRRRTGHRFRRCFGAAIGLEQTRSDPRGFCRT
jgi:hypothetical protein